MKKFNQPPKVFPVLDTTKHTQGLYPSASIPVRKNSEAIGNIVAAKKQVMNSPTYPTSNSIKRKSRVVNSA
jgi:hypothetical protein